ncbi:MAG TPA: hypothetical protein ENN99_06265 [Chloroflexi bacterium]|nr:hypothetical protein [Chloroflexota bacterium]
MPTLGDIVTRLSFLAAMPAVAAIFITTSLLVVSREWRLNVFALAVQYFFVVLLMTRLIRLEVAAVKGLIGWMICMVFYMTERRASELASYADGGAESISRWRRWVMSARAAFCLLSMLLVAVAANTAALRFPLPEVSSDITLACYVMAGLGLLLIGLSEAPMQVGFGLLTFLSAFDLFYVALEPSLAVAGLLGAVSFLIALAVAYLRASQVAVGDGESSA